MTGFDLPKTLEERGAVQTGHFRLSSGRHSPKFVQKFRILEQPALVERIAGEIVARLNPTAKPNVVISAAVGAIVLGYEVARQLGVRAIFVEKELGVPALRRGFVLGPGDRVLVVEDVVTTGGSVKEVIDVVRTSGAAPVAVAIIVRREPVDFGLPTVALVELPIASYAPEECPQCKAGEAITEPGSRFLK
ncbi:MAG: orotate phosphoribosyltransferase [Candidatus Eremiobacteraeota bacterium]|nr:orotate phosphoribosyltransferase [Candidatus Eremiobacteraeota bacterium]